MKKIIDPTGTVLTPSLNGWRCKGNGEHKDEQGDFIECCCDECNYYLKCFPQYNPYSKINRFKKWFKNHFKNHF